MSARPRHTNLALAVVVPSALGTGALAFAVGSAWGLAVVAAHGVVGIALLALSPAKARISRRGFGRRTPRRTWPSVLLAVLLVLVVGTGFAHATGLARSLGPVTAMQVHVAAAIATLPLFAWHVFARPVAPRRTDLSRRTLLRSGAVLGAAGAAYASVAVVERKLSLPGSSRRFTGSYQTASFDPARFPVTQWLDDHPPALDPGEWRVRVSGGAEREWSLAELSEFGDRVRATLDCTGGWYSAQDWGGARLSRLLPDLGEARSIEVRSATGYVRRFPASDADALLLAVRVGGRPLSVGHGAPARLVAPGRRGFWWVKWVTQIRASEVPWWWQPPFPLS